MLRPLRPLRLTLTALVVTIGLGGLVHARPAQKVDWSEYLEPPGARQAPLRRTTETPRVQAKANKKKKKKPAKMAKRSGEKQKKRAARGKRR
ncbi:MAG: hypothetical protein AB7O24_14920 [Kofleriaceae bacterium]